MSQKPLSILVADDDLQDLELLEEAILNIEPEARVKHVVNGKKVMEFLNNCSDPDLPCLIVLDYNMPEMTGAEVLKWLCSERRYLTIPKVMFSTSNSATHKNLCRVNGAIDYFVKPFNLKELNAMTKKMLSLCTYN